MDILVNICAATLPDAALLRWEQSLVTRKKSPKWHQMKEFLTTQYEIAERVDKKVVKPKGHQNDSNKNFF